MRIVDFLIMLFLGGVCAALGQFLTGYSRGGCPVAVIAGFFGVYVGPRIAANFGFAEPIIVPLGPYSFPLVSSLVGGFLLVVLVNLITKHRKF
jgi:uncharacterized membrane protein YeaQ/YmgE (transglycosylase-associated protein family)